MKSLLIFITVLCPFAIYAQQDLQGIITYEETTQLRVNLPEGADNDLILSKLPSSRTAKKELVFKSGESIYKNIRETSSEQELEENSDGMVVKMVFSGADNQLYQNIKENKIVEQTDFMGRQFRILEDINQMSWKLTQETKQILNYNCIKAILKDTARQVEAWFTMQIPASFGPANYRGLPGLILSVDVNDGERLIHAKSIQMQEVDEAVIKAPSKGKEVSREEFRKIRDKKIKEMQEENGGSGNVIIKRF